jgi:hypothetical protein
MSQSNTVQIRNIAINEFALVAPQGKVEGTENFNFEVNFAYNVNVEQSMVNVLSTVSVATGDKKTILARIQTVCGFVVNKPEFSSQDADGKITIEQNLAQDLNAIALSTTRGVLFANLKGTYLHNAVLPVIDMTTVQSQQN